MAAKKKNYLVPAPPETMPGMIGGIPRSLIPQMAANPTAESNRPYGQDFAVPFGDFAPPDDGMMMANGAQGVMESPEFDPAGFGPAQRALSFSPEATGAAANQQATQVQDVTQALPAQSGDMPDTKIQIAQPDQSDELAQALQAESDRYNNRPSTDFIANDPNLQKLQHQAYQRALESAANGGMTKAEARSQKAAEIINDLVGPAMAAFGKGGASQAGVMMMMQGQKDNAEMRAQRNGRSNNAVATLKFMNELATGGDKEALKEYVAHTGALLKEYHERSQASHNANRDSSYAARTDNQTARVPGQVMRDVASAAAAQSLANNRDAANPGIPALQAARTLSFTAGAHQKEAASGHLKEDTNRLRINNQTQGQMNTGRINLMGAQAGAAARNADSSARRAAVAEQHQGDTHAFSKVQMDYIAGAKTEGEKAVRMKNVALANKANQEAENAGYMPTQAPPAGLEEKWTGVISNLSQKGSDDDLVNFAKKYGNQTGITGGTAAEVRQNLHKWLGAHGRFPRQETQEPLDTNGSSSTDDE